MLLVFAAIAQVVVHVLYLEPLSPFDEYFQIDYLAQIPNQPFVRTGQTMGEYSSMLLECRGIWGADYAGADCTGVTARPHPDLFEDKNLADVHGPLFFLVSALMTLPFRLLGVDDLLMAARLTNIFWLSGAAALLYGLVREFGGTKLAAFGVGIVLIGSPAVFWSNTFFSIDASALASGAALVWCGARYLRGTGPAWQLVAIAPVVVALKFHNIAAVGLVALALVIAAVLTSFRSESSPVAPRPRRLVLVAVLMTGVSLVVQLAWVVIRAVSALGPRPDDGATQPFSLKWLLSEVYGILESTAYNGGVGGATHVAIGVPLTWFIVAGVFGALVVRPLSATSSELPGPLWQRVWPGATAIMVFVAGPAFIVATYLAEHRFFDIPPRYGLSLLPAMLLMATLLFDRSRVARVVVLVLGLVAFGVSLAFV